jgi:hypothetical protein
VAGKGGKNVINLVLFQLFNDIDGIIRRQIRQLARQRRHAHHVDDLITRAFGQIGKHLCVQSIAEDEDQPCCLRFWQTLDKIGLIGRVKRADKRTRALFSIAFNGGNDRAFNFRRKTIERGKAIALIAAVRRLCCRRIRIRKQCLVFVSPCHAAKSGCQKIAVMRRRTITDHNTKTTARGSW